MTKANDAYNMLAKMIETGRLEPGTFQTEAGLMEAFGLGRTPLREALHRLDRNHLVRIRPGRGIEIPSNSIDEQLRRLEVRRAMEVLAVALACERATAAQLADIQALTEELDDIHELDNYIPVVRATHDMLCEAAHNEYLADAMNPLQGLSRRFWLAHVVDGPEEVRSGKQLHLPMLRAILARDAETAQQASLQLNDYLVSFALGVATRNARVGRLGAPQY